MMFQSFFKQQLRISFKPNLLANRCINALRNNRKYNLVFDSGYVTLCPPINAVRCAFVNHVTTHVTMTGVVARAGYGTIQLLLHLYWVLVTSHACVEVKVKGNKVTFKHVNSAVNRFLGR